MWFEGMTCRHCNTRIAKGEAKDHVGNFWFHVDETKNCLAKYLRGKHDAMQVELEKKRIPGNPVKKPIWRFHRNQWHTQ